VHPIERIAVKQTDHSRLGNWLEQTDVAAENVIVTVLTVLQLCLNLGLFVGWSSTFVVS